MLNTIHLIATTLLLTTPHGFAAQSAVRRPICLEMWNREKKTSDYISRKPLPITYVSYGSLGISKDSAQPIIRANDRLLRLSPELFNLVQFALTANPAVLSPQIIAQHLWNKTPGPLDIQRAHRTVRQLNETLASNLNRSFCLMPLASDHYLWSQRQPTYVRTASLDISEDIAAGLVRTKRGEIAHLSPDVYRAVRLLLLHPNDVITYEDLGRALNIDPADHQKAAIDVFKRANEELAVLFPKAPPIETIPSVGFGWKARGVSSSFLRTDNFKISNDENLGLVFYKKQGPVLLDPTEIRVLRHLLTSPEETVSFEALAQTLQTDEHLNKYDVVRDFMRRLNLKLEPVGFTGFDATTSIGVFPKGREFVTEQISGFEVTRAGFTTIRWRHGEPISLSRDELKLLQRFGQELVPTPLSAAVLAEAIWDTPRHHTADRIRLLLNSINQKVRTVAPEFIGFTEKSDTKGSYFSWAEAPVRLGIANIYQYAGSSIFNYNGVEVSDLPADEFEFLKKLARKDLVTTKLGGAAAQNLLQDPILSSFNTRIKNELGFEPIDPTQGSLLHSQMVPFDLQFKFAPELELNPRLNIARWKGKDLILTPTEFEVLQVLLKSPKTVVSLDELFQLVWGEQSATNNDRGQIVRVFIFKIRSKFKQIDPDFDEIRAARGAGYVWASRPLTVLTQGKLTIARDAPLAWWNADNEMQFTSTTDGIIPIAPMEHTLLLSLMRHAGRPMDYNMILPVEDRKTFNVFTSKLNTKLQPFTGGRLIISARSDADVGFYKLDVDLLGSSQAFETKSMQ